MKPDGSAETVFDSEFNHLLSLSGVLEEIERERVAELADVDSSVVDDVFRACGEAVYEEYPYRNPETLFELYYLEGLTQREIAERLDCTQRPVTQWMKRHNIAPGRGNGPTMKQAYGTETEVAGGD